MLLKNNLTNFDFNTNLTEVEPWASYFANHVDLPRMRAGRHGGQVRNILFVNRYFQNFVFQFWSAFIGCGAQYKDATKLFIEQIDVIKRLVAMNPDDMEFVTTAVGGLIF